MNTTRCIVCRKDKPMLDVVRDLLTGFYICHDCRKEIIEEVEEVRTLSGWLRAIANVIDRKEET